MGAIKFILLCFLLLLSFELVFGNIIINEIMYNPSGSDSGHEWIEIYSNETINISGWKFYEDDSNHGLNLINGTWLLNGYAVIADEYDIFLEDYPDFNGTLIDSSWSSLSNSGEYIAIKNSSLDIINFINYSTDLADGNGKSLSLINNTWAEANPTPGYENGLAKESIGDKGLKISVYINDLTYIGLTYTSLFKIENLDHVSGIDDCIDLTIGYNISFNNTLFEQNNLDIECLNSYKSSNTGFFEPKIPGNYTITGWIISSDINDTNINDDFDSKIIRAIDVSGILCNISLNITIDKEIYLEEESVKFNNNLNNDSLPFTIEYYIEDFFGNFYKNPYNTTNTNQKSWKTNIDEQDRVLFIKAKVYPLCNDTNLTDNSAEKRFIVKSDPTSSNQAGESKLEIIDSDDKAKFGEIVDVKISAYRGNTNKYSVSLYIADGSKKISEITKIHLSDGKYSSYYGRLPIQIKPNCDLKLENGKYEIVLEGLGEEVEEKIKIEGIETDLCESIEISSQDSSTTKTYKSINIGSPEYNIFNQLLCTDHVRYKQVIYESKNEEIKRLTSFFIIILTTLLVIILILKTKGF